MAGPVHVLMIGLPVVLPGRGIGKGWLALAGALTASVLAILPFGVGVVTAIPGAAVQRVVMAVAAGTDAR